jgi:hypothetical protein
VTTARGTPVSSANFAASFFNFLRVVANSTIYLQHAVLPNGAAQRYGANAGGSAQTEPGRQCTGAAFTECKSACTRGASWISCLKAPAEQWRIPEKGHRATTLGMVLHSCSVLEAWAASGRRNDPSQRLLWMRPPAASAAGAHTLRSRNAQRQRPISV